MNRCIIFVVKKFDDALIIIGLSPQDGIEFGLRIHFFGFSQRFDLGDFFIDQALYYGDHNIFVCLFGFTMGLTTSMPTTILAELFPEERATVIGVYNLLRYTGSALGPMIGSLLYVLMYNSNQVYKNHQ
ncbi:MFS transporter [Bacillus sp. FJAT-27264]|uniref:MFS transporter n=1 Tax=Paenibacillus sp. (strain DSM 101736 / FJAT-27264) TaxID=1850362 RepID=UPI0011129BB4|nr:MFS transporter [Bacillus sp. FJAT-27264]